MKLDVNRIYQLKHPVRIHLPEYYGETIPVEVKVKIHYWDDAVVECEIISGRWDGIKFATHPDVLVC
jgi:hypothetical protein